MIKKTTLPLDEPFVDLILKLDIKSDKNYNTKEVNNLNKILQ